MSKTVFERYELKYLITNGQKERLLELMEEKMLPDSHGKSCIRNLYYDTPSFRLIRRSLEKPVYKEKLRVRSYCAAGEEDRVFVELKKKYRHIVYKRRIALSRGEAEAWLSGERACPEDCQISREIDFFRSFYQDLSPKVFLSYEREAFFSREREDLRVTFDDRLRFRTEALSLGSPPDGREILDQGRVLMEIKCAGGLPLWMTSFLSREKIYQTSFSKYGTAYQRWLLPEIRTGEKR